MKINYKVLWIEDHFEEVEPFIEGLENKLQKYGFVFNVDRKTTLTDGALVELSDKLSNYNPYDMVIFDYDLGDKKGDEIASQLRGSIYTDMIFYSGVSHIKLRQALCDKKVDGVYIVTRDDFINDSWPIIEDQIKRIFDINNMRGVLLDEMSKIDLKMRNLYGEKYDNLSETDKGLQLKKFNDKLSEKKKAIATQIKNTDINNFPEMIKKPTHMDFNTVRSRLKSITENDELFGESSELKTKQDLRNKFAHNMAEYDGDKGTVSLSGFDKTYGFEEFTQIRKELIMLLQVLEGLSI